MCGDMSYRGGVCREYGGCDRQSTVVVVWFIQGFLVAIVSVCVCHYVDDIGVCMHACACVYVNWGVW